MVCRPVCIRVCMRADQRVWRDHWTVIIEPPSRPPSSGKSKIPSSLRDNIVTRAQKRWRKNSTEFSFSRVKNERMASRNVRIGEKSKKPRWHDCTPPSPRRKKGRKEGRGGEKRRESEAILCEFYIRSVTRQIDGERAITATISS